MAWDNAVFISLRTNSFMKSSIIFATSLAFFIYFIYEDERPSYKGVFLKSMIPSLVQV